MPDGRTAQERGYQGGLLRFLYGMILEWKELPCKSAESAHRSTPVPKAATQDRERKGMVQPPVPTVLNALLIPDDRTSVDGHISPGPKRRPVRYIASLRETGWVFAESAKQRVWRYTVPPSTRADAPVGEFV
jgi:hypothetical protein